jgi:hypothetical protein
VKEKEKEKKEKEENGRRKKTLPEVGKSGKTQRSNNGTKTEDDKRRKRGK